MRREEMIASRPITTLVKSPEGSRRRQKRALGQKRKRFRDGTSPRYLSLETQDRSLGRRRRRSCRAPRFEVAPDPRVWKNDRARERERERRTRGFRRRRRMIMSQGLIAPREQTRKDNETESEEEAAEKRKEATRVAGQAARGRRASERARARVSPLAILLGEMKYRPERTRPSICPSFVRLKTTMGPRAKRGRRLRGAPLTGASERTHDRMSE